MFLSQYVTVLAMTVLAWAGITTTVRMWSFLGLISLEISLFGFLLLLGVQLWYCFSKVSTILSFSFPNTVQGSIFAFLLVSNLIMFGLVPIVSIVKEDYESGWPTYQKWMTAMILLLTLLLILISAIAFDKLPNWLHKVILLFNTVENNINSAG